MNDDPSTTPESFRHDMAGLQDLIIELSNIGYVNQAREFVGAIEGMEREFGALYLQTQETQR